MPEKKRPVSKDPKPRTGSKTPKSETKAAQRTPDEAAAPGAPRARKPAARSRKAREPFNDAVPTPVPPVETAPASAPETAGAQPLSILMVSAEAHPFAKTGGLAEVVGALPFALARLGHSVTLVLPRYRGVTVEGTRRRLTLTFGQREQDVTLVAHPLADRVTAMLVDVPELFDRKGLYGQDGADYEDNAWRFAVLSLAALEYARQEGQRFSVIHAHDWQTGLVPVFQKTRFASDPVLGGVPTVFTIHNLAFQGLFPALTLPALGLGWELMDLQGIEYWGKISYLKGGINFSERITTVSPTYAREIVSPDLGFGFDGVLRRRAEHLSGILNGIDVERWNPQTDPYLPAHFGPDDLSGKASVKQALLETVGLPVTEETLRRPLIGLISRLTDQKGYDLISEARGDMMRLDASWVMLGSGEKRYEEDWRARAAQAPDRVATTIGFDERAAHLIEAGADMFLMPSRFEPCGLNQMYSHRYGTVPIVRATGGLQDTVRDPDEGGEATGFKFREYSGEALVRAVERALAAFQDQDGWRKMQFAGMRLNHSWDASAREYVKVYEGAAAQR